jgi:predicted metal-dependent peptidase
MGALEELLPDKGASGAEGGKTKAELISTYRELSLKEREKLTEEEARKLDSLVEVLFREPLDEEELRKLNHDLAITRNLITSPKLVGRTPPSLPYFKHLVYGVNYTYSDEPPLPFPHYANVTVQNGRATVSFTPLARAVTEEELPGLVLHELFHVILDHWDTPRTRSLVSMAMKAGLSEEAAFRALNYSADMAINSQLRKLGYPLYPGAIEPELYGLPPLQTTEFYFTKIIEAVERVSQEMKAGLQGGGQESGGQKQQGSGQQDGKQNPQGGQGGGGGPQGDGQSPQQGSSSGGKPQGRKEQGQDLRQGQGQSGGGQGQGREQQQDLGQGGGGGQQQGERGTERGPSKGASGGNQGAESPADGEGKGSSSPEGQSGGKGGGSSPQGDPEDPLDRLARSLLEQGNTVEAYGPVGDWAGFRENRPTGLDSLKRQVAQEIRNFGEKNIGDVPAYLARWAEEILDPQVPWEEVLRASLGRYVDYHRDREDALDPSRFDWVEHALTEGKLLPFTTVPLNPKVAVLVDTSGSMGQEEIMQAVSEVLEVAKRVDGGVTLITFDAEVKGVVQTRYLEDIKRVLLGGGGTDLVPAFEAAKKENPDLIVVVTDGYVPKWPDDIKDHQVFIVCTSPDAPLPEGVPSIRVEPKKAALEPGVY